MAKPKKKHAVGILARNRYSLTEKTLESLAYSQQPKDSYDLYIIDNASSPVERDALKSYVSKGKLPIKNVYILENEMTIPKAWNLFLEVSQNYEYRTVIDNDMVLRSTLPTARPVKRHTPPPSTPADADAMAGAPISGPPTVGSKMGKVKPRSFKSIHTRFLEYLSQFSKDYQIGIAALLPCSPKTPFHAMMNEVITRKINGNSYLMGGCVMIDKPTFDKLGYFDERIECKIDIEYSQRAIKNGINIGYHPFYWAIHMGATTPTAPLYVTQAQTEVTWQTLQGAEHPELPYTSVWSKAFWKLRPAARKNIILNLK